MNQLHIPVDKKVTKRHFVFETQQDVTPFLDHFLAISGNNYFTHYIPGKFLYLRVDKLIADFTGKKDVRAQTKLISVSLVTHGLPKVPQAEDCC